MNQDHTVFRRVGVFLAAQLLSLLDVFIFPDSLDASLPGSQLHGLALVRSTEKRIGSAQGPLLTSLIRLSLLLLCHLEPCSVELLQCSSRLRCFLHWVLELIRESETLEGYTAAFNKLTAPFDRLILAIVLQCHRTLGRCGSLLSEIESTPYDTYFENKESQKKSYRRLLRVALELRDILLTTYERRKEVLRTSMSSDAYEALRSCLETPPSSSKEEVLQNKAHHSKEIAVRALLSSDWVTKYQDVDIKGGVSIPCMLCGLGAGEGNNSSQGGARAIEELSLEDNKIVDSFEQSLNVCFEKYLEAQRQWAETGAVRDLEFDGDMTLKRLSKKHSIDLNDFSKNLAARNSAMDVRWRGIYRKVTECWKDHMHWKLARYTDRLGRRILLVPNRQFDDHSMASYDLMMGKERGKGGREERLRHQRELLDEQLSEVMKRNTDAFVPFSKTIGVEEEEKEQDEGDFDKMALQNLSSAQSSDSGVHNAGEVSETGPVDDGAVSDEEPEVRNDVDAWAKTFIWSDSESVVARFESVVIVTLQYLVEGSLLLTTHGLYFHQTGDEINVVTREPIEKSDASNQSLLEVNDRRWRLSRLAEVHGRRYMLRAQALELFFSDSHELFLNFLKGDKERNRFNAKLRNSCKVSCSVCLNATFYCTAMRVQAHLIVY